LESSFVRVNTSISNLTENVNKLTRDVNNRTENVNRDINNLTENVNNLTENVNNLTRDVNNLTENVNNLTRDVNNLRESVEPFIKEMVPQIHRSSFFETLRKYVVRIEVDSVEYPNDTHNGCGYLFCRAQYNGDPITVVLTNRHVSYNSKYTGDRRVYIFGENEPKLASILYDNSEIDFDVTFLRIDGHFRCCLNLGNYTGELIYRPLDVVYCLSYPLTFKTPFLFEGRIQRIEEKTCVDIRVTNGCSGAPVFLLRFPSVIFIGVIRGYQKSENFVDIVDHQKILQVWLNYVVQLLTNVEYD